MPVVALMAAPAKTEQPVIQLKKEEIVPDFAPKWWHRPWRLDARPLIWSLDNSPEDWRREMRILCHEPSRHCLGASTATLYRAGCSCENHRWQLFQRFQVRRAIGRWLKWEKITASAGLQRQFQSHFLSGE